MICNLAPNHNAPTISRVAVLDKVEVYHGTQELYSSLQAIPWQDIVEVLLSVAVVFLVAYYGGKLLIFLLKRITRRTKISIDNELLEVIRPQISWLLLAMGFQFVTNRMLFSVTTLKT